MCHCLSRQLVGSLVARATSRRPADAPVEKGRRITNGKVLRQLVQLRPPADAPALKPATAMDEMLSGTFRVVSF